MVFDLEIYDDDPINIKMLNLTSQLTDNTSLIELKVFVTMNTSVIYGDGIIGASPCPAEFNDYSFAH